MRIAVIGRGQVGGSVGRAAANAGHVVVFGSRHPSDEASAAVSPATVGTVSEAIEGADVVVVAVPGRSVEAFAHEFGDLLAGKLVVDAANRMGGPGPLHSAAVFAEHAPRARYARAFNTLGWENFAEPSIGGVQADLFFSSADADRREVEALVLGVGLRPVFVGPDQHDLLDGVLRLWFALAVGQDRGRHLAFKVLDESGPP